MTPARFWAAAALFHLVVLLASWFVVRRWRDPARCQTPLGTWLGAIASEGVKLALIGYLVALLAPLALNAADVSLVRLGDMSGRLMGQLLFGEFILLGGVLAVLHLGTGRPGRAALLGAGA